MSLIDDLLVTIDDKPSITREELLAISENPSQKAALYSALARLVSKGLVKRDSQGFKITDIGKKRLDYFLDALSEFKNENKKWRLILVEISEKQRLLREKLRYEFKKVGVGTVKKGVYIFYANEKSMIEKIIDDLGVKKRSFIIEIEQLDQAQLITAKAWDWQAINWHYQNFIENQKNFFEKAANYSDDIKRIEAKKAVIAFSKILLKDPRLPDRFNQKGQLRTQALKLYEKIRPYCYD